MLYTMFDLMTIAADWSFWDRPIPSSVLREVDLPRQLSDRVCLVVQGVRRCGKSVLLQQLMSRYELNPANVAFLNFEDPRLGMSLTHETLDELVLGFRRVRKDAARLAFFLDEIQMVQGWQRWLRAQLERPSGNLFVVTGSNAELLSGELSSALTGRHLTVELYPFSLSELRAMKPAAGLEEYLELGGFPEPLAITDGDRLLRQYFDDIVERDIRERLQARSSLPIRQVVQMAYESAGSEMSLRRIAGAVGIAVDTASAYLEASEAAYMVQSCPFYAHSARRRASRSRKYYPIDTGLRRVVSTRTGRDLGKTLECAVHLELRKRFKNVFYWREKVEVDFVVQDQADGKVIPVQVTWDEPLERHHRAMEAFYENFPTAEETLWVTAGSFEEAVASLG